MPGAAATRISPLAKPESPSAKLLRAHSRWRLAWKIGGIVLFGVLAFAVRFWVVEGVQIPDRSMLPKLRQGAWVWVCKTQRCIDGTEAGSGILLETHTGLRLLRVVAAGPGAILQGDPNGKITTKGFQHRLRGNPWFLSKENIRIPHQGDSLVFAKLNPAEMDLALRLYRTQKPKSKLQLKASLWIDGREVPIEKASIAQLHGIPVKPAELGSLSWQELQLVEMQVLRQEHGSSKVEIRRKVFQNEKPLLGFKVKEDCFFAVCLSGNDCVDSRDIGYVPRNMILGKVL